MKVTTFKDYLNEGYSHDFSRDYNFEYKFNSFDLSYDELYKIADYGLNNEIGRDSGCWDVIDEDSEETPEECMVEDFMQMLSTPFRKGWGLRGIPKQFTIYRIVNLENGIESLDESNLGLCWFTDPNAPKNDEWWGQLENLKRYKSYVLEALVDIRQVNIIETLFKRSMNYSENELKLKVGENPKFLRVLKYTDWVENPTID